MSARYLASHFSRIDCWAFPEPEREAYDQVVLLGYRKAEVFLDGYAEERIHQWAAGEVPELGPRRYPLYVAPATPAGDVLFATRTVDPVAAAEEARHSGLWASTAVTDLLWPAQDQRTRPLMPLRRGHLAMLVAAGFLDNLQLEAGDSSHPRQGPHLQGDGPGRAHAHEGDLPRAPAHHRRRPRPGQRPGHRHRRLIASSRLQVAAPDGSTPIRKLEAPPLHPTGGGASLLVTAALRPPRNPT